MIVQYLGDQPSLDHDSFRLTECGPAAAEAMCQKIRDFLLPGGKNGKNLTLGDYFDRTPKGLITKTILEEKVFDTWYDGRTVLLGDGRRTLFNVIRQSMPTCIRH